MELLANDLSIHEQFRDVPSFRTALEQLMAIRGTARRFEREVHCNRALLASNPIPNVSMQQAIGQLPLESQRRSAMVWLTRGGPFWDDIRQHGPNDWLECQDEIVTEFAIGEAAYRILHGVDCGLVSVTPSDWDFSPVPVTWVLTDEGLDDRCTTINNWSNASQLENDLRDSAQPIRSWDHLRGASAAQFEYLKFSDNCFEPLRGVPFAKSCADRFLALLHVLDQLAQAFDTAGRRTSEGHRIFRTHFTGERAWFSDSSETEKNKYRTELTFPHPDDAGSTLFCPRHGKVSRQTLRLHYSWSGQAGDSVFVVYAGPKITKG